MKDTKNAMMHLREHQKYPATKADLVTACYELKDFSPADKKWFAEHLPEGTYHTPEEVMQALGMNKSQSPSAM